MTLDEARSVPVPGWNLRCNRCGSYGAEWLVGERPGYGSLALCPVHARELRDLKARHASELAEARRVLFEQGEARL